MKIIPQPYKRSRIRLFFGVKYYTVLRYCTGLFRREKFAKIRENIVPHKVFFHSTPMLRELKDVDMTLQYNKIANLKIAAERLNNITLKPGETFSYWKAIGKPSKSKGYLEGMILQSGKYGKGTGGGLCQMSNLIYWMTLHTPLTVIERHRHGYDVFPDSNRTQPFGSGATCFYNYLDLMIKNSTDEVYQLHIWFEGNKLCGEWCSDKSPRYTYEVYEKQHFIQSEYWGGYTRHNIIFRRKMDRGGIQTADEFIAENHAVMMYNPLIEEA